ncbi:AsnC family protein [Terasakiella sp.]|uniref:siroheme decarboxylase subunit beta n=1 Tax=Terasakiella sp. TaxID=2034861 RepID=UPI003AA84D8A
MALLEQDYLILEALQGGLPLVAEPYKVIADQLGMEEAFVLERLNDLLDNGTLKRFGVIVRHHELGYRCNGMCVWEIPIERIDEIGHAFSQYDFVTLCYERNKRFPDWPYNLFCMIHAKDRTHVLQHVDQLVRENDLADVKRDILFSTRRFKQRGARYNDCRPADVASLQRAAQ